VIVLFCECNDYGCFRGLPIDDATYTEAQKKHPGAAIVLVGHEDKVDDILEEHDNYLIVKAK
jgi:hypothetical protein